MKRNTTLRRALSLLLSAALLCSLSIAALAAGEAASAASAAGVDQRLAAITQLVKDTLGLDTEVYTDFYGDCYEGPGGTYWDLSWSSDAASLSVTATDQGQVVQYNYYDDDQTRSFFYGFQPAFPKQEEARAKQAATAFLSRVLAENETAVFDDTRISISDDQSSFWFTGSIQRNDLPTPLSFNLRIQGSDLAVTRFYRSDAYDSYVGIPDAAAQATATQADAQALLKGSVDLELIWVLGQDNIATLQYVPKSGNYIVDALTGELVDLDALYAALAGQDSNTATAEAPAAESAAYDTAAGLSQAEQAAVDNLEGVLSSDALDARVRAIAALGLTDDFSMTASYTTNPLTGDVTCNLNYSVLVEDAKDFGLDAQQLAQQGQWGSVYLYKNVSVDAKTGALTSYSTSCPVSADPDAKTLENAVLQTAAADFLAAYGSQAAQSMTLYDTQDGSVTFAQVEQDYFFPANSVTVGFNTVTGTIDSLNYQTPDQTVAFAPVSQLLTPEQALDAYMAAGATELQYVAWPIAIDPSDPLLAAYADYGYSYVEKLALAYAFDAGDMTAVDAATGAPVLRENTQTDYAYDDLAGCYGETAILALAEAGVGLDGDSFLPAETVTQRVLASLLLSTQGYSGALDDELLKTESIYYGFFTAGQWDPDREMTRMEVLRAILNASEYGKAAALSGAYRCTFSDESAIEEADYGYVSIAQALGMVHGTTDGNFSAYTACSRQDAALMLYNFMSR